MSADDVKAIEGALAMGPTPGPWGTSYSGAHGHRIWPATIGGLPSGHYDVGVVFASDGRRTRTTCKANAQLIAACSPDVMRRLLDERAQMVEALRDLVWQIEQFAAQYGEADFETGRARTILARAEGGEHA